MVSVRIRAARDPHVMFAIGLFGFASGLPLALTGSTLQAWLTHSGLRVETIGALSLVGIPYLFKFLWAPFVDRYPLLANTRRRGWLLLTQTLLAGLCVALAMSDPAADLARIAIVVLLLAIISATQDIAVDAYRAEALAGAERGLGAGISVAGYRVAMMASGAGALLVADRYGFDASFWLLAGCFLALLLVTTKAPEPASLAPPATLGEAFGTQLRALSSTPGIIPLLALIVCYKLGDAFAGSLSMTFFLRGQGFSLTEIGAIYKALGLSASILGGILGGYWMISLGLYRALLWFGVLQAITNLGFLALAAYGKSMIGLVLVVGLENLAGGMGTSGLLALMMALCMRRYTATHFALLSALASIGRVLIGPLAGQVAATGWVPYFAWSLLLTVPGLVLVIILRHRLREID